MADELRHKDVVSGRITENEYENINQHIFNSQAKGDLMIASSATQLSRLGITDNRILISSGGLPVWASLVSLLATRAQVLYMPCLAATDLTVGGGFTAVTGGIGGACTIVRSMLQVRVNSDIGDATYNRPFEFCLRPDHYRGVNWDKEMFFQFSLLRQTAAAGGNAIEGYVQIKGVSTKGALSSEGIGIRVLSTDGLDIRGESYESALGTADFDVNLTTLDCVNIGIHHRPGVSVDFYVNGTLQANNITGATKVPAGIQDALMHLVVSLETTDDPNADINMQVGNFLIIQAH